MYVEVVSVVTEDLYQALRVLIPQLSAHKAPPTRDELEALVESESSTLLVAHDSDERSPILGVLCLTVYRVPTGVRCIIEDVVVEGSARRRGIGEALMQKAIELAREAGAEGISLTSNPQRQAANLLYQSLGFQLRETNPYYFRLK